MLPELFYTQNCKNFAIFTRKQLLKRDSNTDVFLLNIGKFLRTPILNICVRLLLKQKVIDLSILGFLSRESLSNHPDLVILQKYLSLSNQSFKHSSTHIPSLNLTPALSFEPRFYMFIINGYDTKQTLVVPRLLVYLNIYLSFVQKKYEF